MQTWTVLDPEEARNQEHSEEYQNDGPEHLDPARCAAVLDGAGVGAGLINFVLGREAGHGVGSTSGCRGIVIETWCLRQVTYVAP